MNYVHDSLTFLIQVLRDTVLWLFSTEIVQLNNSSISIGQTFVYFFIVYLVISLLLNAKVGLSHETLVKVRRKFYSADHSSN